MDEHIRKAIEDSGCHILTVEEFERMAGEQFEKGTTPPIPTFHFTVTLKDRLEFSAALVDAIHESGCGDATVSCREGKIILRFSREASSYGSAVQSACVDLFFGGFDVEDIVRDEEPPRS